MAAARSFCRLRREIAPGTRVSALVPEQGMCLSAFLVLSPPAHPGAVLLGRIRPEADWEQIGGLDANRLPAVQGGWMLPSCHLMIYESPHDAARRIVREQLERADLALGPPLVVSDTSSPAHAAPGALHWDLGFVFPGVWESTSAAPPAPWSRLELVELSGLRSTDVVRGQADILAYAGRRLGA
ncbi:MAG: hypothetical protein ABSA15_02880 [Thermoplasmata archaeon]|jgi:hypothetical protein